MSKEAGVDGERDSYGDNELADLEKIFGSKVKDDPTSALRPHFIASITSEAGTGLERETLSHHWSQKSKQAASKRNFFAKKMWQPFFLIII